MSELTVLQSRHKEELLLVGIRLNAQHPGPQLYTYLVVGGENERPLTFDGRIVFFPLEHAQAALALDPEMAAIGPAPTEPETFCDVAETLYLVNSQNADTEGVILDCLLVLDDLVRATKLHMPDRYQGMLTELAARLTEGAQLRNIFHNAALREHVEDALLWCVGAVAVKSQMITR